MRCSSSTVARSVGVIWARPQYGPYCVRQDVQDSLSAMATGRSHAIDGHITACRSSLLRPFHQMAYQQCRHGGRQNAAWSFQTLVSCQYRSSWHVQNRGTERCWSSSEGLLIAHSNSKSSETPGKAKKQIFRVLYRFEVAAGAGYGAGCRGRGRSGCISEQKC